MQGMVEEQEARAMQALWEQRYASLRAARYRLAAHDTSTDQEKTHALVLRVGARRLAMPLAQVAGVVPLTAEQQPTPVPGAPPEFWGLLLLRGEICPVFDLGRLLGLETAAGGEEEAPAGHVVFVRDGQSSGTNESAAGWKVDRVEEIITLPDLPTTESQADALGRFITRIIESAPDATPLLVLDAPALLEHLRGGSDDASLPAEDADIASTDDFALASIEEE